MYLCTFGEQPECSGDHGVRNRHCDNRYRMQLDGKQQRHIMAHGDIGRLRLGERDHRVQLGREHWRAADWSAHDWWPDIYGDSNGSRQPVEITITMSTMDEPE